MPHTSTPPSTYTWYPKLLEFLKVIREASIALPRPFAEIRIPAKVAVFVLAGVLGVAALSFGMRQASFFSFGFGYVPPEACYAWYDGCNMCERTADGVTTCSHRLCEHKGKGFCRANFPEVTSHVTVAR